MFHCHLAIFTKIKHVLSYFFRSMSESSVVVSESDFISRPTVSGARFSKVPIINGPGKLSPFISKIEVSKVLYLA